MFNQLFKSKYLSGSVLLLGLLSTALHVQAATYVEGKDFTKVAGVPEVQKSIVREFFSYNCPHCYHQDTKIDEMVKQLDTNTAFERTPVGAGRPSWVLSQEAYYIAQKLKLTRQVHGEIFKQIHEKHAPFNHVSQLKAFYVAQGVTPELFDSTMNSADMKFSLSNYDTQAQLSGIRGVPALLVNGQYLVSPAEHSAEELADIVKYINTL